MIPVLHNLHGFRRVVLLGMGKAAAAMAAALEEILEVHLDEGVVVTKYGHGLFTSFAK